MKKSMILFFLILEFLGLWAIEMHFSNVKAHYEAVSVIIPEDMVLTTSREVSFVFPNTGVEWFDSSATSDTIVVPEGTTIKPRVISENKVAFYYEGSESDASDFVEASWDCFIENEQLARLWEESCSAAELRYRHIIQRGVIKGVILGLCWLVIGSVLSIFLIKKQKLKMVVTGHILITVVISIITVVSII